jgi:hypothetical protein
MFSNGILEKSIGPHGGQPRQKLPGAETMRGKLLKCR